MRNRTTHRVPATGLAVVLAALLAFAPGAVAQDTARTATADTAEAERAGSVRALGDDGDLAVTGDRTIAADEVVDDIVVAGGDLRVEGTVRGDALVLGGDLILEEGGRIRGDAVVAGGEIIDHGGRVSGDMRQVDDLSALGALGAIGGVRAEADRDFDETIEDAVEHAVAARVPAKARDQDREPSRFAQVGRRLAMIVSTIAWVLVLAGIGAVLIFYGRRYLDVASDTVRASPLRAGAAGLAATFLAIPLFVVLVVALAVSIIGIPLLLVAVPLYPVAVFAAAVFGLLAVAHALGERTAEQQRDRINLRHQNSYAYLFIGIAMLYAPLVAADLIGMTGFLDWISTLLKIVVFLAIWAAVTIGLGAVLLSRGGTRPPFTTRTADPFLDAEPFSDPYPDPLSPDA